MRRSRSLPLSDNLLLTMQLVKDTTGFDLGSVLEKFGATDTKAQVEITEAS